eukprot:sb/3472489/
MSSGPALRAGQDTKSDFFNPRTAPSGLNPYQYCSGMVCYVLSILLLAIAVGGTIEDDKCLVLRFPDERTVENYARQEFSVKGTMDDWTVAFWFKRDNPTRDINPVATMFSFATNDRDNELYVGLENKDRGDKFHLECIFNDYTEDSFLSGIQDYHKIEHTFSTST